MSNREFRCGSSSEAYSPAHRQAAKKEEPAAARLVTQLHLAAACDGRNQYRVLGVEADGGEALIGLAASDAQAMTQAAGAFGRYTTIRIERWSGVPGAGQWVIVRVRHARQPRGIWRKRR
jgi:hypothetical protein